MTLIAFGSAKGSPGVTTAVVALAAVWPVAAVLADCDPAGGDVALRLTDPTGQPLWRDRGLVALAALTQRSTTGPGLDVGLDFSGYLQTARGGLSVLVGLESAAQATAIGPAWPLIGQQLRELSTQQPVLADCGRLTVDDAEPPGAVGHLWRQSDLLVLCTHPRPDALVHLLQTLYAIAQGHTTRADTSVAVPVPPIVVVVIDDGCTPDPVEQVRRALHLHRASEPGGREDIVGVLGGLAHDPAGAAGLAGTPTRRLDRCPLIRSARLLAPLLADRAQSSVNAPAPARESACVGHDDLGQPARDPLAAIGTTDIHSTDIETTDIGTGQDSAAVMTPQGALR